MLNRWKIIGCAALVVATLIFAKWNTENERVKVAQQEQSLESDVDKAIASSSEAFALPMPKSGMIQDYAEFGKVARFPNLYHSAADYYASPGDPVYAVANGIVYFSGYQEAYGGLVIVQHEREGIYSLYGHVSAKRWLVDKGDSVKKGQLIGYIADTNEGYGIGAVPHLHFSIRLGKPEDYPMTGRESWMTGYTTEHPAFHRFVDPNKFIVRTKQFHNQ
ncbi:M23 family metallopeptidase [Vibrio aquaticus]|uniref:M23 family metallopeptidase n=1 Tax=Vibrio aquaticus TaxID=2496559 RepID=A0A3S0MLV3_9VIBR|nr:M23 family metallopeptidase [Vibrio aquaticus]RTZ17543.1 M23 family metallopeptidase [Vibrio aquaticus]